ncbi:MAG TPA: hypothetical protein PLR74_16360, partial [Agriterribacter sp.]|nr:hypothetical protein [Agriterribacter sp.]
MPLKNTLPLLVGLSLFSPAIQSQTNPPGQNSKNNNGWSAYGGDAGGSRYASLQQINSANVKELQVAWTYQTGELNKYKGTAAKEKAAFEATPILVDGTLYF